MRRTVAVTLFIVMGIVWSAPTFARDQWPKERAAAWGEKTPWLVGSNYVPQSAINQLEMWQADTFDAETIDRELGWAKGLGFNSLRVFLHDIPWRTDRDGYFERIDRFLDICKKHDIGVMFVLFDSVWDPEPKAGKQPAPRPHVHNSGWVQGPGRAILEDPARHDELKGYVIDIVGRYRNDPRVQVWDLVNEPDNPNTNSYGPKGKNTEMPPEKKQQMAYLLVEKAFAWAREAEPSQPLTVGVWGGFVEADAKPIPVFTLALEESDVISFHNYRPLENMKRSVERMKQYGRPVLCTEYMARPVGSTFDPILGYLKQENVGAYNWGFVSGKSQTIYAWETWQKPSAGEPELWFHDIFRPGGTPYIPAEVQYIRQVTGAK
ncbi:MAG: cellulase family glycosylhydrolase [Planctomycetota bacterium]